MLTEARALALFVLFTLVGIYSMHREAQILTVCTQDCEYQTLSQALAAAPAGSTIFLKAGHYEESHLIINKSVKILGQGSGKVYVRSAASGASLIQVRGESKIHLEQVTLIGGLTGIELRDQSRAVIRHARFVNQIHGITLVASAQAMLDRNEIRQVVCAIWTENNSISLRGHSNVIVTHIQGRDICGAAGTLPVGFKS